MNEFSALINSYDYALKNDMVDRPNAYGSRLLPLYHTSLSSNGKNILTIRLRRDSTLFSAEFLTEKLKDNKDKLSRKNSIIFPVTADSISRSGSAYRPHALDDSIKNIFETEGDIRDLYLENLETWIDLEKDKDLKDFLSIIKNFLLSDDVLSVIGKSLYNNNFVSRSGFDIFFREEDDVKKINLKDVFLEFIIVDFKDGKDYSVTDYIKLHQSYINYADCSKDITGICNISGESDEIILRKHRGVIGNSKIFGLSNTQEVYFGRFADKTGTAEIGRKSSEKILLTLKYLIDNPNSRVKLSENTYLLTWFSEDIENKNNINITYSGIIEDDEEDVEEVNKREISDTFTRATSESFKLGKMNYDENSSFYTMIVTKVSDGRTTIDYFKELSVSKLNENLKKWEENYSWYNYDKNSREYILKTPSVNNIILTAYGVERKENNKTKLVAEPKNFKGTQQQNIIMSILEGRKIPSNITQALELNIRNRLKYKETWRNILFVSQAILKNKEGGGFVRMLDENNFDRSYLFGRLISIYENVEKAVMDKEDTRATNAEKFWNTFINKPATTINILESKTHVYFDKLKTNNYGLYVKYKKAKDSILILLSDNHGIESPEFNKPLDYKFIFGYTAQNQKLFESSKKQEELENTSNINKGEQR